MTNQQNNQWIVSVAGGAQPSPGAWRIHGYHRARFLCTSGWMSHVLHSTSAQAVVPSRLSEAPVESKSLADLHPESIRMIGRKGETALANHYASVASLRNEYRHVPFWDTFSEFGAVHEAFYRLMVPGESPYVDLGDMQAVLFLSADGSMAKMVSRKGDGTYQELTMKIAGTGFTAVEVIDRTYHQPE